MLKGLVQERVGQLFIHAMELNRANILELVGGRGGTLLDLGCADGTWTMQLANAANTARVIGVEITEEHARQATARGIEVHCADLTDGIPLPDASVDVVHSNQVIEHVPDVDKFASEIFRVLRPGGIAVISTENASSWHNIGALFFGWQMFSLTNFSTKAGGLGNPMALHRDSPVQLASWTHKVIFSHRGLIELFTAHGFTKPTMRGAGYYPLPAKVGLADSRHAHFLALRITKPEARS